MPIPQYNNNYHQYCSRSKYIKLMAITVRPICWKRKRETVVPLVADSYEVSNVVPYEVSVEFESVTCVESSVDDVVDGANGIVTVLVTVSVTVFVIIIVPSDAVASLDELGLVPFKEDCNDSSAFPLDEEPLAPSFDTSVVFFPSDTVEFELPEPTALLADSVELLATESGERPFVLDILELDNELVVLEIGVELGEIVTSTSLLLNTK
ncbi:unnamed protein product [Pneumocystis jirovecii]|uniref:Uncharacterized protein n=1 Tax=Pneumocystis jirovecii TaxID=42068 RepID=L0PEW4_PNEJI|nr:unnamed protein product [Pneumocystis jirovecii]